MQIYRHLFALGLALAMFAISAQALTLGSNDQVRDMSADIAWLEDPTGQQGLTEISSPANETHFKKWGQSGDMNLGFSASAYWVRLRLAREPGATPNWIIEIPYLGLEKLDFYAPGHPPVATGAARPLLSRAMDHRYFVFPVMLETESQDYYFRIQSQYALEDTQITLLVQALYFGGLLALLIYNFFLWVSLRDLRFLLYTLFCTLLGLGIFAGNGFGRQFLWPNAADFDVISQTLLINCSFIFGMRFALVFLKGREVARNSWRALNVSSVVCIVIAALLLSTLWVAMPTSWIYQLFLLNSMVAVPLVLWTGFCALRKNVTGARFFLVAWCLLLGGGIIASLRTFGIVPTNSFTAYSIQIASSAEMLLLALALADTVRYERDERELAQRQVLASTRELMQVTKESAQRLELAVEERTSQLKMSLASEKAVLAQYLRFGSLISHEFRNPLGIIDSQVALLKKELPPEEANARMRLDTIISATQRLVKMFDTWLSDGQAKTDIRPMQVRRIMIADWLPPFLKANRMFFSSHQILLILDPLVMELQADQELLDIALVNLLDNACKYSPEAAQIIITSCAKPGFTGIRVTDNGIGILPEHQDKVFEEYFRIPSSEGKRGTGLGLPFVKNIVNNHRGHVELSSVPGEGSSFTMWFPLPAQTDYRPQPQASAAS